jgi:hypothetical protein
MDIDTWGGDTCQGFLARTTVFFVTRDLDVPFAIPAFVTEFVVRTAPCLVLRDLDATPFLQVVFDFAFAMRDVVIVYMNVKWLGMCPLLIYEIAL